jgi:pilus assembly protein CpaE
MGEDPAGHMSKPPTDYVEVPGVNPSVALISPREGHLRLLRRTVEAQRATIMRELSAYPTYAQLNSILEVECDAVIVEIDSDLDVAMDLVEAICARKPSMTVMVYSSTSNPELMSRSMRAGAREFLADGIPNSLIQDALIRAAARRTLQNKKVSGEAFVFWGAKGGSGVTTIATNFALALRMEAAADVALLDLNCRLGDVAVLLGLTPRFTVTEALKNAKRLDQDLISTLFVQHRSGVAVLAAPDTYDPSVVIEDRAVGKLIDVVRNHYSYVVVDAGRDLGDAAEALLQMASTIYLVTQLDIPSLRNAQRLISYMQRGGHSNVELVINRYEARKTEIDDAQVSKALGLQPKWKIANDFAAARKTSNVGSPLIHEKSPVAAGLRAMARAASGKPVVVEKRKGFSLFGS